MFTRQYYQERVQIPPGSVRNAFNIGTSVTWHMYIFLLNYSIVLDYLYMCKDTYIYF